MLIDNKLSRRGLLSVLAVVPAARLLATQDLPTLKRAPRSSSEDGEEKPKLAEARLINIYATVKDKSAGKLVKDLTQDDFTLDEEGKPQTIKFFEAQTAGPLSLGILVETSYQQSHALGDIRTNGIKFVDQILRENDQGFVIHFDKDIELLQDFTNSRDKLGRGLDLLQPAQPSQQQTQQQGGGYPGGGYPGGGYPGGGGRRYPQGGGGYRRGVAKIYDAILLASDELMSKQKGQKAILLFGDGVDSGSKTTLFEAITSAQKADTTVHTVHLTDEQSAFSNGGFGGMGRRGGRMPSPGGSEGPDGKKILQQIADETGGSFNSVGSFHHIDKVFADLQEELRSQYNIGYIPDPLSEVGLFRHIHLAARLKKKDLVVQVRSGYYVR